MNPTWPERGRLRLAVIGAAATAVVALCCRIVFAAPAHDREPLEFVLFLMAAAALCIVGLARHRHVSVVWLGCIAAAMRSCVNASAGRLCRSSVRPSTNRA